MKKTNCFIVLLLLVSTRCFSQGMMPPPPISSPLLDALMGTWTSEPYDMMGMKCSDVVVHKMILNGQFMEVDIKSTMDNGFSYEGLGIVAPSKDGMTGWFYDIFGKNGIMTYSGNIEGNKIMLTGVNDKMTEERVITVDGNTMTHDVTFKMKDSSGGTMPEQKITITYKKQ